MPDIDIDLFGPQCGQGQWQAGSASVGRKRAIDFRAINKRRWVPNRNSQRLSRTFSKPSPERGLAGIGDKYTWLRPTTLN